MGAVSPRSEHEARHALKRVRSSGSSCDDEVSSRSVRFRAEDVSGSSGGKPRGAADVTVPQCMTFEDMMLQHLNADLNE